MSINKDFSEFRMGGINLQKSWIKTTQKNSIFQQLSELNKNTKEGENIGKQNESGLQQQYLMNKNKAKTSSI